MMEHFCLVYLYIIFYSSESFHVKQILAKVGWDIAELLARLTVAR